MNAVKNKISKKKLTPLMAIAKMESWCAYQERSQYEVRNKLFELGLSGDEAESIISGLIENNFLNEERFAEAFARGKFRIKNWGRIKIKIELKAKRVSDYCITKAMKQINGDEYFSTLEKIIERKNNEITENNKIKKRYKLIKYAMSRGFEQDLIMDAINNLNN